MWKKQKGYVGNGKKKKTKVAWESYSAFPMRFRVL
jgi:hypothetical protein